jgi:murein tripeptide amidase MpaA
MFVLQKNKKKFKLFAASATATYFLNELLYSQDPEIQDMAENIDWYIIPVMNPDGFEYTKTDNRNWRKSRSRVSLTCWGVDPNRNWAHNWLIKDETGDEGASRAPCSDTYAGPHPFSENETIAVEKFLTDNHDKFDVYLSFHSYAHQILFPYGHTRTRVSNFVELEAVGLAAAAKLKAVNGIDYEVGSTIELLCKILN